MPGDFLVTFRTREGDYRHQVNLHCPICPRQEVSENRDSQTYCERSVRL